LIPLGSIVPYALPVAPPGWAICDGSLANRSDGSGTIQTPDLRGRTLVGATEARPLGTLFGNAQSTLTTTAAGRHGHPGTAQIPETAVNVSVAVGPATQETTINQTKGSNWDAGGGTGAPVTNVTVTNVAHSHPVTVTPAPIPARSVDLSIGEAGDHAHQITVDLHQPSASIVYIMKV
jgi:microcystin-dependent protein